MKDGEGHGDGSLSSVYDVGLAVVNFAIRIFAEGGDNGI